MVTIEHAITTANIVWTCGTMQLWCGELHRILVMNQIRPYSTSLIRDAEWPHNNTLFVDQDYLPLFWSF